MELSLGMCATIIKGTPEDKEKLPQIIRDHKEWLADHAKGRQACLKDMNLEEADLSGVDLSYADLSGAYLHEAKMTGTKLTGANLDGACLDGADLTNAVLDEARMSNVVMTQQAILEGASMQGAIMRKCVLWESKFTGANLSGAILFGSQLCDCSFENANLVLADLSGTNLDNTVFKGADMKYARLQYVTYEYYADFTHADVTGVDFSDCYLDEESFEGAVGFHPHMRCPEEGSFIAWKKCRDNHIVKLLIPESAQRTGANVYNCRASEAVVLDIWDEDNEPCEEAFSFAQEDFVYRKGETVCPAEAFDGHLLEDGSGIHFFLTRTEAEQFQWRSDDDDEDEEDASNEGSEEKTNLKQNARWDEKFPSGVVLWL